MAGSGRLTERFFTRLLLFSFRRRRGIRIAVVLVTLASGLLFSRAAFTNDVAGLFPPGSATGNAYLTLMASGFSRRITVEIDASGIGGIDGSGCAAVIESAAGELRNISGVEEVFCRFVPRELGVAMDELSERLPELVEVEQLAGCDPETAAATALKVLLQPGPGGSFMRSDPFGVRAGVLAGLEELRDVSGFVYSPRHFFPVSADGSRALLSLEISVPQSDTAGAERLFAAIENRLREKLPAGVEIRIQAPHLHAIANEKMLRRDVNIVVTLSLVLLLALFYIVYRGDVRGFWIPVIPVIASLWVLGLISGCGMTLYVFVIGMGGGIIGLAVDQGIHLYSALRGGGIRCCGRIAPSLLLGMLTTAAVFGLLTVARSPALTQLGIFAGGSLLLSWVLNLLLLPPLLSGGGRVAFTVPRPGIAGARLVTAIWGGAFVVGVVLLGMYGSYRLDLDQLDGAATGMAAAEQDFTAAWRDGVVPTPLLMLGRTREEVLLAAEKLSSEFPAGTEYFSPVRLWPSRERRERNLAGWREFTASGKLDELEARLNASAVTRGLPDNFFAPFFSGLRQGIATGCGDEPPELVAAAFSQLVRSTADGGTALMMLVRDPDGRIASGLRAGDDGGVRRLMLSREGFRELLSLDFGAVFFAVLGVAALVVTGATALFFRRVSAALLALTPVATTMVVLGGGLAVCGIAFNPVLSFAAVVLVGLAVDYGIFAVSALKPGRGSSVPEAMALSAATTVCAVGALLFSAHPILFQTGLVLTGGVAIAALTGIFVVPALAELKWRRIGGAAAWLAAGFIFFGCASQPEAPPPSRAEIEAGLALWRSTLADRFTVQSNWVIDHWFFTLPLIVVNRVAPGTGLETVAMMPTGTKLFAIGPEGKEISPLFPRNRSDFPEQLYDDLAAVYCDNAPELPEKYEYDGDELCFSIRGRDGEKISYRFVGTPPILREKRSRGFWRTHQHCIYDEYQRDASGRMVPARVRIMSNHSGVDSVLNATRIYGKEENE